MRSSADTTYRDVGILSNEELGLKSLLKWINPTQVNRAGKIGSRVLDIGYFANVVDLGRGLGLALTCDGVGTKILVAEALKRYDTIGIDCVAMNVNDLICVGAEPISMLDYVGIEQASPEILEPIGRGLHDGAQQAGINIVGGEVAQLKEMIRGIRKGAGIDLVGMCIGVVPLDRINTGQSVVPGDVVIGLQSSGIHSNGLTLARSELLKAGDLTLYTPVEELGCTLGEELLKPTRIYGRIARELLMRDLPIKALVNITSDGFLNLTRVEAPVGFQIDNLPTPQPIFRLIQERGPIASSEMFRVFNMGIGFCIVVPDDEAVLRTIHGIAEQCEYKSFEIGKAIRDPERKVLLPRHELIGKEGQFFEA